MYIVQFLECPKHLVTYLTRISSIKYFKYCQFHCYEKIIDFFGRLNFIEPTQSVNRL